VNPADPASQVSRIIAAVQLENVRLSDAQLSSSVLSRDDVGDADVHVRRSSTVAARDSRGFRVAMLLDLRIVSKDGGDAPAVSIRCTFELTYALPEGFETSSEALERFAEVNATFNAWPYWREFVQTTMARMNLPPFVMPVFRLQSSAPHGAEVQKTAATRRRRSRRAQPSH